tara:strand:- start:44 stop:1330 length:1287 start_codon:yes stop_codon:yes gene_type:complete
MADRSISAGDTLNKFRFEFNGTAEDIGDISGITGASGIIASATDVVEAIVLLNPDLTTISTDSHIFTSDGLVFEGATDDGFETSLVVTDPTADRTFTLPDASGEMAVITASQTYTNKTITTPTITSAVLNTGASGTAVLDEDTFSSNSATKAATQQSIKAYVDTNLTAQDLDIAPDSGTEQSIDLDSETLTLAGGTGIDSSATSNTATFTVDSTVTTLAGTQTLTNKTLTSPTLTSAVLNTAISGTAFLDEDDLDSNSATKLASQQSIKAYVDAQTTAQDLDFAADSGGALNIDLDSEVLTVSGGTGLDSSATGNTLTVAVDSTIAITTASQTLTNKTFTEPVVSNFTLSSGTVSGLNVGERIIIEGSTSNDFETSLDCEEPTQDNVITIPDTDMTLATTATHVTKGKSISLAIALGSSGAAHSGTGI